MNYFFLENSGTYQDKYIIRLNHDSFPFPNGTKGSYGVLVARLLNLSYTDYLRYARDKLGAELVGKNTKYVIPYFDKNELTMKFVDVLNKRMKYIMFEQEHPYDLVRDGDKLRKESFNKNESNN